jgi:ribonuclease Z
LFEVLFLGTSASAPSAQRGLSALIVKHGDLHFLVDCGEGTARQIEKSETDFKHLKRILLTHGHLDHILGVGGLVGVFRHDEPIDELEIFGGKYTLDRVRPLVNDVVLRGQQAPMPLHFREITPGTFLETADVRVSAFPVFHRGLDSLGYLFEETNHRSTPDGLPAVQDGVKLAIVGDTGRTDNLIEIVQDADALVIEATYIDEEKEMARQFSHLTARDAAGLAVRAGVKQLILTHISRRYRAKDVLAQARAVFPNTVVARDLENFQIGDNSL